MNHLPPLIYDLGILLLTGGLVALLFGVLRQPLIVGYLLAGYLLGPNVSLFPSVSDGSGIHLWGEIGILFVLFSLGLEFSFKKLLRLGPSSLVATTVEFFAIFSVAWLIVREFGWGKTESLFVAGMLSISSTAILVRAIEDSGTKSARFAGHVVGILIVEDIYSILLLVVLATLSTGKAISSGMAETGTLFYTVFKFAFFFIVVFVVGMTILPVLIRKSQRFLSDEMRLILSLGLCFITVVLAAKVGFSPALGAFLMGSLLAGTREAKRIEGLLLPVRYLFASIFFISIGMQIDPSMLIKHPGTVLVLLGIVLIGKPIFVTLGLLVSGKPLRVSIRSGVSMAQIGEFSFIIAALGTSLGLVRREIGSIIVMVATVTALTTPYAVHYSKRIAQRLEGLVPERMRRALERYEIAIQQGGEAGSARKLIRSQVSILIVNAALIGAVALLFERLALPIMGFTLAVIASAPFFWGVAKGGLNRPEVEKLWKDDRSRPIVVFLLILRGTVFISLAAFLASRFLQFRLSYLFGGAAVSIVPLFFSKRVGRVYEKFTRRFHLSLSEGEGGPRPKTPITPWDGHIAVFEVSIDSFAAGRTLMELQIRERYGVTVTLIERGNRKLPAPSAQERIFPYDRIHAIGSDDELANFREFIEVAPAYAIEEATDAAYSLEPVTIGPQSSFVGRTIRQCGVRERAHGLVVGVERGGKRILNPGADFVISSGDLLWIVGETAKVRDLAVTP